ncbi:MAG TPA: hypothetical protein VF091_09990 [Gaiellaceae bacterium]
MSGWDLFGLGLATVAVSLWYARRQPPLPPDASWWSRSSRSYADWKGSWAPVFVPIGLVLAAIGLALGISGR